MLPELPALSTDVAPWLYYSVGALATLIVGIGKAGFGGGVGIVAVPILTIVLPTNTVLGVLLPLLIAGDVFSLPHYWGKQSNTHTRWLCVGATFGFVCGAVLLTFLQRSSDFVPILNLSVGGICLSFVLVQAYRLMGGYVPRFPEYPAAGRTAGFLAAFAATLAHAAGPLVSLYLLEQRLEKQQIVATNLLVFFWVNMAKLAIYAGLGLVTATTLMQSLSFLPFIPMGTMLGAWLHTRIPERPFIGVLYTGAAVAAVRLIYKTLV
jgi:uncharacterized membrane protein YfcA